MFIELEHSLLIVGYGLFTSKTRKPICAAASSYIVGGRANREVMFGTSRGFRNLFRRSSFLVSCIEAP